MRYFLPSFLGSSKDLMVCLTEKLELVVLFGGSRRSEAQYLLRDVAKRTDGLDQWPTPIEGWGPNVRSRACGYLVEEQSSSMAGPPTQGANMRWGRWADQNSVYAAPPHGDMRPCLPFSLNSNLIIFVKIYMDSFIITWWNPK